MGFLDYLLGAKDYLLRTNISHDPADNLDRTNINSGIFQAREAISKALAPESPLLQNAEFPAIALWVSSPFLTVAQTSDVATIGPSSSSLALIPKMMIKIYFRVPVMHSSLPVPPTFSPASSAAISKLKPEEKNILSISCHPYLYADFDSFSGITAGDIITIRFDDKTYSSAKIVKTEEKSTNSIVPVASIGKSGKMATIPAKELFEDAVFAPATLGSDIEVSQQARKLAEIYYDVMKERSPCKFLSDWKARFQKSFAEAESIAKTQSKKYPDSIPAIRAASEAHGVPYNLLLAISKTESRFNPQAYNTKTEPGNKHKPTYATGLFQILPPFYVSYGLPAPPGPEILQSWVDPKNRTGHDAWDPYKNSLAAAGRLKQNLDKTTRRLGRTPEPWEVYVTHNQGHDTFYVQTVACGLYGPGGGVNELATALQLIVNNNFNVGVSDPKPKNNTNQNVFFGGRWHTVPKTNEKEWSEGLSPDLQSLRNLTRT